MNGRALHYVFKIGEKAASVDFFCSILGMKVLRHEEFSEGCEAQCNGAYANRWSKTMIGYGPEDTHFVVELTHNYGVNSYQRGNDFLGLLIQSSEALDRVRKANMPIESHEEGTLVRAPGGYPFILIDKQQPTDKDPVQKVTLASSDLLRTSQYWNGLLSLKIVEESKDFALFTFNENQIIVEFRLISKPVEHAEGYGRIAFSIPTADLKGLQKRMEEEKQTILTPFITLPTPGKASVSVVILADPDGHEICFVGDEGFRELSQIDPEAENVLQRLLKKQKK